MWHELSGKTLFTQKCVSRERERASGTRGENEEIYCKREREKVRKLREPEEKKNRL